MSTTLSSFANEEKSKGAFGIDLGTTNSCIAVVSGGNPQAIKLDSGSLTLPSCVMWKGGDKFIVGDEAYQNRFKASVAYSTKRVIGKLDTVTLKYGREEKEFTPAFISSLILKGLVEKASHTYPDIKDVTITVPAYFDNNQIQETLKAAELAKLNVLRIVKEPTAAAHAYEIEGVGTRNEKILVYDLGGGTFDVSVLEISKIEGVDKEFADLYDLDETDEEFKNSTIYRVLAVGGDNQLGGDDIDNELTDIILSRLGQELGIDTKKISKEDVSRLTLLLEKVKKKPVGNYSFRYNFKVEGTNYSYEVKVTPQDMDKAVYQVYKKTRRIMKNTLSENNLENLIDRIVLVGGSTKSEILRGYLAKDFPSVPVSDALNPDESVALGAAVIAQQEKYGDANVNTFDILPIGIGVVASGKLKVLIQKGQTVPYETFSVFSNESDNQESAEIEIRQGDSSLLEKSISLGKLVIDKLPPKPANELAISVGLKIDSNGVLSCNVLCDGKKHSAKIVNIFTSKSEDSEVTSDDKIAKVVSRLTKLKAKHTGEKAEEIQKIIDKVATGEIVDKDASKLISSIITKDYTAVLVNSSIREDSVE